MKQYEICEVVKHYHLVGIDDEIEIEEIIAKANDRVEKGFGSGRECLEEILEVYKGRFGFDYQFKPNYCGTETEDMNIVDEVN